MHPSLHFQMATKDLLGLPAIALQMAGVLTTAWGILQTRLFFDQPGIVDFMREWWRRFPLRQRRDNIANLSAVLTSDTLLSTGYVWSKSNPSESIETRLETLEANVERLNQRLVHAGRESIRRFEALSAELREEKFLRVAEAQRMHAKLETAHTGGLSIAAMGLWWLVAGSVMSSGSVELALRLQSDVRVEQYHSRNKTSAI